MWNETEPVGNVLNEGKPHGEGKEGSMILKPCHSHMPHTALLILINLGLLMKHQLIHSWKRCLQHGKRCVCRSSYLFFLWLRGKNKTLPWRQFLFAIKSLHFCTSVSSSCLCGTFLGIRSKKILTLMMTLWRSWTVWNWSCSCLCHVFLPIVFKLMPESLFVNTLKPLTVERQREHCVIRALCLD